MEKKLRVLGYRAETRREVTRGIEGGEKIWFSSSVRFVNQHQLSFDCEMTYFSHCMRCLDAGAHILCVLPW